MISIEYEADAVISFVVCSKTSWNLAVPPDSCDVNVTLRRRDMTWIPLAL